MKNKTKKLTLVLTACVLLFSACSGGDNVDNYTESNISEPTESTETETAAGTETAAEQTLPPQTEPVYYDEIDAVLERAAVSEKNPFVKQETEFIIDRAGAACSLSVTYESYIDIYTLQHCIIDVDISEGEYSFGGSCLNADGTVDLTAEPSLIVTDLNGKSKKYAILLERELLDLPVVNIYLEEGTERNDIDRYEYSKITFYMDCSGTEEFEGTPPVSGSIRGRGHSTWRWAKKPYRIKLDEKASLLGLDKNKDWILLANYADKSLIRNCVAYDMGRELEGFVWDPSQYPVDLFINGQYQGVYTLGEQREIAKSRIDLYESDAETDRGYLLEIGGATAEQLAGEYGYFHTEKELASFIAFADPKYEDMTEEQRQFITDYVNAAEAAIVSGEGYEEYIDVQSFCDWIIIHELTCNLDSCFRRSCYINKDRGGKLQMGPIWDFDLAFGNYMADYTAYSSWFTLGSSSENAFVPLNWCNYLMSDKNFRSAIRERWFEVRDRLVQRAMTSIDYYREKTEKSQQKNFEVWDIMGKQVGYEAEATSLLTSYEEHIQYLRDFIYKRAEWIDNNI